MPFHTIPYKHTYIHTSNFFVCDISPFLWKQQTLDAPGSTHRDSFFAAVSLSDIMVGIWRDTSWRVHVCIMCIYTYIYIHSIYIYTYLIYIYISGSARNAPGRKFRKKHMAIGNRWPIGKFLRCRNNEALKLWGASTNEQMAVELPMIWHERITAQLNEWRTEGMNRWTNESMNQWMTSMNLSMKQRSHKSMNQRINGSPTQGVSEATSQWIHGTTIERSNESMKQRINESRINEAVNLGVNESMNQRFELSINQWTI